MRRSPLCVKSEIMLELGFVDDLLLMGFCKRLVRFHLETNIFVRKESDVSQLVWAMC